MALKTRTCALCLAECRKRDVVCACCWKGLPQSRRDAIALAPYSREEKVRKFITDLLTCDIKVLNQRVAENKVQPEAIKAVYAEVEAVFTEINPGKGNP